MSRRPKNKKRVHWFFKLILLVLIVIGVSYVLTHVTKNEIYPKHYNEYVSKFSEQYDIDENFIYAVIKTESNFIPTAESEVGARGLMQIMNDAFEWSYTKIGDDEITYDDMFDPQYNIEYGCFMLSYYYEKYGSYELSAAAYHSGMGQVDSWISDGTIDNENIEVSDIPASKTRHYVNKVMSAFKAYDNLY
ncbi:MAG: lytic transglycosylase domain-containing protein [Ruminococcus sp.]|nr:lytic transglycosylase domain-containing protein [Ruminococcus sp.]